uniref:THAP-type domain-containing protein n=1 Tax=Poecilia reticulata TaxID=8081 RepID=A0A3P9N353_POERE
MPNCCVTGCHNRYYPGSTIRFYRVPSGNRQFQVQRRRLWIEAIQQANGGSEIRADARICGVHFISVYNIWLIILSQRTSSACRRSQRQKLNVETKTITRGEDEETEDTINLRDNKDAKDTATLTENEDITALRDDKETEDTTNLRDNEDAKGMTTLSENEDITALRDDNETEKSPSQPASECPMDHQSSALMETSDELLPEMQTWPVSKVAVTTSLCAFIHL